MLVSNSGLAPTMIPPDTLTRGGGADALPLTVQPDAIVAVEYAGLDTLLDAGGTLAAFTVRFRDRVQNLVDNDGAALWYASTTGRTPAAAWALTRASLGAYRTPPTPFPQADTYRIWLDTAAYGALAVTGANQFRVQPLQDSIVTFTGLETRYYIAAGDTLPSFTAAIVDKLGNPTDNSSLRFSYARTATAPGVIASAPASNATVRAVRLQTGLYRIESTVATVAGVYTYSLASIPTMFGQRTVEVLPRSPVSVNFGNVRETFFTGGKQTAASATFRDRFGNLTDSLTPSQLRMWYSNSTDATVSTTETLTASETLTQRVNTRTGVATSGYPYRGVYDASSSVVFPAAAKYSLAVEGISTTSGTTAFEVLPNADYRIVFENVPDTLTAGDSLKNVVVRYFDKTNNPTDNGIGRVLYSRSGGSSTATVSMVRTGEGVYALNATQATLSGNYTMIVSGIASVNYQGRRTFVLRPSIATTATFVASTTPMTRSGSQVTLTVTYKDQYGNLTDNASAWKFESTDIEGSTGTVALVRKTGQPVGVFTTKFTVFTPGGYRLDVNDTESSAPTVQRVKPLPSDFSVLPGPMRRATWTQVQARINPGSQQTPVVQMYDTLNAPTNYWDGTLTANFSGAASGTMTFTQPEQLDQFGEALYSLQ